MNSSLPSYDLNRLFAASGTFPKDSGGEAMILEEADDDDANAGDVDQDESETEEEEDREDSLEDVEDKEVLMSDSLNAVSWSEDME